MKQKYSLFAAAAIVGATAFAAQETWFTAPIDSTMDGWSGDTRTFTDADTDYIEVVSTGETPVAYTPTTAQASGSTVVRETVTFMADAYDELPAVSVVEGHNGQTAIAILDEGTALAYYAAVSTNSVNAWVKLTGATPTADSWQTIVLEFDYSASTPTVSFYSGSTLLTATVGSDTVGTFTCLKSATSLSSTAFVGAGNIAVLSGTQGATFDTTVTVGESSIPLYISPSALSGVDASERATYLSETKANGYTGWQNYVMGVTDTSASNTLKPVVTASDTTLTITPSFGADNAVSGAGVTVAYTLQKKVSGAWTDQSANTVETADMTSGDEGLYRVKATFSTAE